MSIGIVAVNPVNNSEKAAHSHVDVNYFTMQKPYTSIPLLIGATALSLAVVAGSQEAPLQTSSTAKAAEKFWTTVATGSYEDIIEANARLSEAFALNGDSELFEFSKSLSVGAAASWFTVCCDLSDRDNIEDFREMRAAVISRFIGRIEGRVNAQAPDFWKDSLMAFTFRMAGEDEQLPFRSYLSIDPNILHEQDVVEYGIGERLTAGIHRLAIGMGVQADDAAESVSRMAAKTKALNRSTVRIDADTSASGERYLLVYCVSGTPEYFIQHRNVVKPQKIYHPDALQLLNVMTIDENGGLLLVWGVTPDSCFLAIHDANDFALKELFFTPP
ncbi:MAG: hypothetical protein U0996_08905 [Planctomycetaceae bacterium]